MISGDLLKLESIFDVYFGEPYLKDGHVCAKFIDTNKGSVLEIQIGRRQVRIDDDLNVVGSGTDMTQKA
jgi:hypothetical protein